jgi:hypothetical protein
MSYLSTYRVTFRDGTVADQKSAYGIAQAVINAAAQYSDVRDARWEGGFKDMGSAHGSIVAAVRLHHDGTPYALGEAS